MNDPLREQWYLGIAYDWEYDEHFIAMLEEISHSEGLSTFRVTRENLHQVLQRVQEDQLSFQWLFDRASDTSPEFYPLQIECQKKTTRIFQSLEQMRWASDKATMHLEFISRGIHTPHTLILPPYSRTPQFPLSEDQLECLGKPFVIKPANTTGGGVGVVKEALEVGEIQDIRRKFPEDKILLQERVFPLEKNGRRFWFRCFYTCGQIDICWWDDFTHLYEELTDTQVELYQLQPLEPLISRVAEICGLQFFSTEISLNRNGELVIVDYVNESCDMRLKSRYQDGVPDALVQRICYAIISYLKENSPPLSEPHP